MKKRLLFLMLTSLSLGLFAQDWSTNVIRVSDNGDTVVINPYNYGGDINSVYYAIAGDTADDGSRSNANRIYKTVRGGVYYYNGPAKIDSTVPNIKIMADEGADQPPLHIKTVGDDGSLSRKFFEYQGNFYAKNQYFCLAVSDDSRDRYAFDPKGEDQTFELDNCILEISDWTFMSNWVSGISFKMTNCFIHNIGREASLEKGCPIDGESSIRELYLENNTFLNCGFVVWTRESAGIGDLYVNHNTFVNMTNNPFATYTQAQEVVTNNLFINTGLVPDYPGFYTSLEDEDGLPKGIINVDTVEDAMKTDYWEFTYPVSGESARAILVDRNDAWWDSKFTTMFNDSLADCSSESANGWSDQKITMNTRTQAMFDDDANYPLFTEGSWVNIEPTFTANEDLVDDWVRYIVSNSVPGSTNTGTQMPNWRSYPDEQLTNIDWPILADLSYSESDLATGALNGYPLGDLNWFPSYLSQWEATSEYDTLIACRDAGRIPTDYSIVSAVEETNASFTRDVEVYPNPTANVATIEFNMAKSSKVEFIIYNTVGERVKVESAFFNSGVNEYSLDVNDLSTGMYLIQLNTSYNTAGLVTKLQIIK